MGAGFRSMSPPSPRPLWLAPASPPASHGHGGLGVRTETGRWGDREGEAGRGLGSRRRLHPPDWGHLLRASSRGPRGLAEQRPVMSRTNVPVRTQRDLTRDSERDGASKVLPQRGAPAQTPFPAAAQLSSAKVPSRLLLSLRKVLDRKSLPPCSRPHLPLHRPGRSQTHEPGPPAVLARCSSKDF